jgi:tetratricopeptide (TPR) repeat protein
MTRKFRFSTILLLLMAVFLAACSMPIFNTQKSNPKLAAQYVNQAQLLEKQGDLPSALEQYKLALTVDPGNTVAEERRAELTQKLKQMADERYQLGMKYHSQGKYALARKEFLTALKFNPDHPEASKMLVSRKPEAAPKYTIHVVKPGESLSMIAKTYYGDYTKFNVIAHFNNLEDATKVTPGQHLMIPELEGAPLPAVAGGQDQDTESFVYHTIAPGESISRLAQLYYGDYKLFHAIARYNGLDDATRVTVGQKIKIPKLAGVPFTPPVGPAETQSKPPEMVPASPSEENVPAVVSGDETAEPEANEDDQILAYRDSGIALYHEGKYEDAVFELNKAIEAAPNDSQTRSFLGKAYFEVGKGLFDQEDFAAAQESFESALHYDPTCAQCRAYIEKSKLGPLLAYRTKGITYFNQNKFQNAIGEFEQFLKARPQDDEIRAYLSRAYYEQALTDYNRGEFMAAKNGFEASLSNNPKCEKCAGYIDQSLKSFKDSHYNKGIVFFGKEQLPEAISEWKQVYDLDPGYKEVEQNLKKARALLEKLERIKSSEK